MNVITVSSFWQFSLTLYKNQLVQSTLIEFQDEVNGNVNLALLCAMLNQYNVNLSESQLLSLQKVVSDFSNQFTQPLRALRIHYKAKQDDINEYSKLKGKLLDAELLFEQQEQAILITELTKYMTNNALIDNANIDNLALYETLLYKEESDSKMPNIHNTQSSSQLVKLTDLNQYLS